MDHQVLQQDAFETAAADRQVVRLTGADAPAISALEAVCFPQPWSAAQLAAALAAPAFQAFGLYGPGERALIAYVTVYHTTGLLEILNIGVLPARRRQGLGRRLLEGVLRDAFKQGIVEAVLDVRVGNAPAIALYVGLGFVPAGRRRRYYADTGEDALVYTLAAPRD